jgi:hypothetical protein
MHLLDRRDNPSSEEGNEIHCFRVCLSKYVDSILKEGKAARSADGLVALSHGISGG